MSKFITVHTKGHEALHVNIDHVTVYESTLARNGSYLALLDFPEPREVTETPEEIDKLIEEAEKKDPKLDDAIERMQKIIDQAYPPIPPPEPAVRYRFDLPDPEQPDGYAE
jgi:hypothetical protein